jgi:hypothetical protein
MRRSHSTKRAANDLMGYLPRSGPTRWGARTKAAVVIAVRSGVLSLSDACSRYMLSAEEFSQWEAAFDRDGVTGLQAKRLVPDKVAGNSRKKIKAAN